MKSFTVALFLAIRSIVRGNLGVTLLTIAMLSLAYLNLLFVPSLMEGIVQSANDRLISTYSSNIIIESSENTPLIRNASELVARIEQLDGVAAVAYRNNIGAELTWEDERTSCIIRGVNPARERQVFKIADSIFEGSYLDDRELDEIVLGAELAGAGRTNVELYSNSLKNVHAGDKVTVTYANGLKKQYKVKGVFYSEFIQTDLQAFVTEREFLSVNPLVNNRASSIHVALRDDSDSSRVISEISRLRSGLKFKTWVDTAGIVRSMTNSFVMINAILTVINLLVAGITVFIVTYIDLANKRRQIGIERAIGITPGAITLSYVFRAQFYAVLAVVVAWLLYNYGVVPLEARYPFHFPFGNVMLFTGRAQIVRATATILGVAVVAAFLPVRQTLRIRILDAIWG